MDFTGRMLACLLAVILIVISPLQYIGQLNSESVDLMVDDRTYQLTDKIRQKGYLDKEMYDEYIGCLHSTGERYEIDIQDIRPVKGEMVKTYESQGDSSLYEPYVRCGLVGKAMTTGTRNHNVKVAIKTSRSLAYISALPETQEIQRYGMPSFTIKAHYNDGTSRILNSSQYKITGFDPSKIGLQKGTITFIENGIIKSISVNIRVTLLKKTCPLCNGSYELENDDTDPGCPYCRDLITGIELSHNYVEVTQGDNISIEVIGIYNDGSRRVIDKWTSNYNPLRLGLQIVTIEHGGYAVDIRVWVNDVMITCPVCDIMYPKSEASCPYCSEQIVNLTVTPKQLTLMQYESIHLDVTAHFADGGSRQLEDWNIDIGTALPGEYTATVSYKGVSEPIELTVLSINTVECPICTTKYDLSNSIKGCPICSKEIVGIEAYHSGGSNLLQLGTGLDIGVVLIFRDDHRELVKEGYLIENFNPNELGVQIVRIVYMEFIATIDVEVVNMLDTITCPRGHVYYINDIESDQGCPFCHSNEDINKVLYFDITYTNEILERVYSSGSYHFQKGNYITVIVTKKNKSLLYQLQSTFFASSILGRKKRYIYGGEVCYS